MNMNLLYEKYLNGKVGRFQTPYIFYNLDTIYHNSNDNIDPEKFSTSEINLINKKIINNPNNLYLLESYIIYYFHKGNLNIETYFKKYLENFPLNPYMLLRYSRYQASSLYKLYNKDKKYILLSLKNCNKAISLLEEIHIESEIPTFIYSWLGYIYIELGKYNKSIGLFDKTIFLNKNYHNHEQSESFLWKAIALNKLGKYTESNEIYLNIFKKVKNNKINNKLDFRVYKVVSDNYYNLREYYYFYNNLKVTIEKFLEEFSFNFNNNLRIDLSNYSLLFNNIIDKNKYTSFLEYNKNYILTEIDNIIFSMAFLYKEDLIGGNIIFNDSRGIEILCYNYLKLIYEGKIK